MKRNCPPTKCPRAFTLIELLIVVAIIAILAAIAVPNFLEAQTRAKVSRARSDMRSIATALESYAIDNNVYPLTDENPVDFPTSPFNRIGGGFMAYAGRITTPIAYMSSVPIDIFNEEDDRKIFGTVSGFDFYEYWSETDNKIFQLFLPQNVLAERRLLLGDAAKFVLWSLGPDRDKDNSILSINTIYDPTNGTISNGNIYRGGPGAGKSFTQ